MEKFGIFELLDALSALTAPQETVAKGAPRSPDAAFAAPAYGQPADDLPKEELPKEELPAKDLPAGQGDAVGGFLARHEAAKKRVKK